MIPVHSNEGMFWSMQYLGADADGNKAAFKLNTATSWDNNQVGIQGVTISEASKKLVDAGGEDNIEIGNPGWYIVVVKSLSKDGIINTQSISTSPKCI